MLLFDMDGTLTEKKAKASYEMRRKLHSLTEPFCIITGARFNQAVEQLGNRVIADAHYVFTENANVVHQGLLNKPVYKNTCDNFDHLVRSLYYEVIETTYFQEHREWCTSHIVDVRHGMLNVSMIGEGGSREHFVQHDDGTRERLIERWRKLWPQFIFSIGGAVSIDVLMPHTTKLQVLNWLSEEPTLTFYGDGITDGNDRQLAIEILARGGEAIQVSGPDELMGYLS